MTYRPRTMDKVCFHKDFGRQMRFIAGPRQSGKTTMAISFLTRHGIAANYYNWDRREVKINYRENPSFIEKNILSGEKTWICFDEIHKMPKWKNILKDFFDTYEKKVNFIVTGSARLDLFRKSGDSLVGRYFLFHLLPFSLRELTGKIRPINFSENPFEFIKQKLSSSGYEQDALEHLLEFSGFPEPLFKGKKNFHLKWQNDYIDHVLNEDLRPLTKIAEIENIANLFYVLPGKVGSPLSINSLKEDLEVSFPTVKNYLKALDLVYMVFMIKPYSQKINRTLKKERKLYFYDWTRISDKAKMFENYTACELKTMVSLWNDMGTGLFDLHYVRTREGKETDFLITRNHKPYLLIEAKLSFSPIESHHLRYARLLGDIPFIQVVFQDKVTEVYKSKAFQVSAGRFFS